MEKGGAGYDACFMEEVMDYLKCVVCHLVVKEPVLLVECGHRFCKTCFDDMKQHASKRKVDLLCPTDRTKVDVEKVFDDKGMARVVMDLQVKCHNHGDGICQWIGELRNLQDHLDSFCPSTEKQRTFNILQQLKRRMKSCEHQIEEKDKELYTLKIKYTQRDEELTSLKEELKNTKNEFSKRIASLEVKKYKCKCSSGNDENIEPTDPTSNQTPVKKMKIDKREEMEKQIRSLQEHVTNTTQLFPSRMSVFTWKLEHYNFHKENTELDGKFYSPKFYSAVNGHGLRLFVKWAGVKKTSFLLGVSFCKGENGGVKKEPFNMNLKFEVIDDNGNSKTGDKIAPSMEQYCKCTEFKPGEEVATFGRGFTDFLSVAELQKFVIDDSLLIKCTLIPL